MWAACRESVPSECPDAPVNLRRRPPRVQPSALELRCVRRRRSAVAAEQAEAQRRRSEAERDEVARGASVRNFGMVWPIGQPPGEDLQAALRSRQLWGELAAEAGFRCAATGSMHLAYADDEWQVLTEFAGRSELSSLRMLTPEEVLAQQPCIVPGGLRGALFSPHEANVDPGMAVAARCLN